MIKQYRTQNPNLLVVDPGRYTWGTGEDYKLQSGITLRTYPGCGHFPHLQLPAVCARDLREFLCDPKRSGARLFAEEEPSGIGQAMTALSG